MKRVLCTILCFAMLLTISPAVFASSDSQMQDTLLLVKAKVSVPSELTEFSYSQSQSVYGQQYEFYWSSKDKENNGNMSVTVYTNGIITNYNYYKPQGDVNLKPRFTKMSKDEAYNKAKNYVKQLNPDISQNIVIETDNTMSLINADRHYFSLYRTENDVPFHENNGSLSISDETGELLSYYMTWWPNAQFESLQNVNKDFGAAASYNEKIGLKLVYLSKWVEKENKSVPTLAYVPANEGKISATTGKIVENINFYPMYNEKSMSRGHMEDVAGALTEEEITAIEINSTLITPDKATEIIKAGGIISLDNVKLASSSLTKNYNNKDDYTLSLSYNGEKNNYVYVSMDAKTGAIKSFNCYYEEKGVGTYKKDDLKANADSALKALLGDKYDSFKVKEDKSEDPSYSYTRYVNGIESFDTAYIAFSNTSGKVSSFWYNWTTDEFPLPNNIISAKDATAKLFEQADYKLRYIIPYNNGENTQNTVLVYDFPNTVRVEIDPFTGKLSSDNTPRIKPVFTDISGHYAEDIINKLADAGIYFDGNEVRPDDKILQSEYIALLSTCFMGNDPIILRSSKMAESVYPYFTRNNVIKAEEKNPTGTVTREDAIKFLIRAMGIDEYASLKGIYNCPFNDVTEYVGHISIAYGMGIVSGSGNGEFSPKTEMTRADALIIIYNFLNR